MNIQNNDNSNSQLVKQVLIEVLGVDLKQFDDEVPLRYIHGFRYDSMTVLECVGVIEEKFGIDINLLDDDLVHTFESVATIQILVQKKLDDQQSLSNSW